ncbi:MAG TPA: biotin/lipoyl-containing protein [Ktedonobacterales bacterium]|nr:biotin/lipoyl-containing protein [Ktedonobacterales bacterium]
MRYLATVGEQTYTIDLQEDGHQRETTLDDKRLSVDWRPVGGAALAGAEASNSRAGHYSLLIGSHSFDVFVQPVASEDDDGTSRVLEVHVRGQVYRVRLADERTRALASLAGGAHSSGDANIRAPMPGLVSNVLVTEGAEVQRGQAVAVLEAMKMENDLTTPRTGIVKSLRVTKGQAVNQGDLLVVVGDPEGTSTDDEDNEIN